jgi:hypothetical protein
MNDDLNIPHRHIQGLWLHQVADDQIKIEVMD